MDLVLSATRRRTLRQFALGLGVVCFVQLSGLAGRSQAVTGAALPPTCAGNPLAGGVHPDCVYRPFASPKAALVTGSGKLTHFSRVGKGPVYQFTVVVKYKNPFALCPEPTPVSAIPCQQPGVALPVAGRYIPGKAQLTQPTSLSPVGASSCPNTVGTCTLRFQVISSEDYGRIVLVFHLAVTDLTTNPGSDLGMAGFEFPLVLNVPRSKG